MITDTRTKPLFIDIETNGLNPICDTIWCCCTLYGDDERLFTNKMDFISYLTAILPEKIVGHNILGFDLSALRRLWGVEYEVGNRDSVGFHNVEFIDTLLLSQLLNPDRDGGHSLSAWGLRLGFPKGEHSDWTQFSPEMVEYCQRDVRLTKRVYETLLEEIDAY